MFKTFTSQDAIFLALMTNAHINTRHLYQAQGHTISDEQASEFVMKIYEKYLNTLGFSSK
ncbi:MAG: hypothetical protein QY310_00210 [Candidatus Jettenia sp. CY-1]|nr:hypothetical protein [Candidatus Jettenia sp.]WKZ19003.1 MAG: hypothetical protein QY310_00210 [Candidatus Jettenia sp. CY-1]